MKPANCKCSNKGRNLVVCVDGTSNQFGERNTNVVELYSKIVTTEDSKQLTYYNSGIGTYAKPSWISMKYLLQVIDNTVDLAIAWNFEKIIIGAYRWLSDNYQENDRIFLFGFSRGAYQVRALAGMIQRVGLIRRGNEEQIPFAYELYATHIADLADSFKTTFSREDVRVHFIGVWDTVSSVGVFRGKSLPLTDSAEHVCFFRHALALDERRVKFLPEYVYGGLCEKHTAPKRPDDVAQIQETGVNPSLHIKEVWFPGTHSDIGGGNYLNRNLDLGGVSFLWMSFEAVSCGLRLRPTRVEWPWDNLQDKKESLRGVWHVLEWMPFKRLSYKDESSTIYRPHKGRGRKIKPGQKVHSSVAFCDKKSYQPKAILPQQRRLGELVGKGSLSNREWVKGWEDLIEMDIFDLSLMSNVIEMLKSGTGGDSRIWAYRLRVMTSTDEGLVVLRGRPNIRNDLVQIFTCADQPEVHQCVMALLAKIDQNDHGALDEMAKDAQQDWVPDGVFTMYKTVVSQNMHSLYTENTLSSVRKRFTADDPYSQDVAKRVFGAILESDENRQHIFDSDVLHSFLNKIDSLNDTECSLFALFLVNQYKYLPNNFFTLLTSKLCNQVNDAKARRSRYNILLVLRDTIDSDGFRKRLWNKETVKAVQQVFNQREVGLPVRSLILKLYKKYIIYEGIPDKLFDTDIVAALGHTLSDEHPDIRSGVAHIFTAAVVKEGSRDDIVDPEIVTALVRALGDEDSYVRRSAVNFFTATIAQEGFRDKVFFDAEISALVRALGDKNYNVRRRAVNFFTATIAQEGFRDKIFGTGVVAALVHALSDKDSNVRRSAVDFFTATIAEEGFRDQIFDTEIVAALRHALLWDKDSIVGISAVEIFTATIAQDGFWDKIFDTEFLAALEHALSNEDADIRSNVVKIFTSAVAQERVRNKMFNTEIVVALVGALRDEDTDIRSSVVAFFTATMAHEDFRDNIFDTETIDALVRALGDRDSNVRTSVAQIFTAALTEEGFRDKICDVGVVAALVRALGDEDSDIRTSAVGFFTAAIAQEGFRDKMFDTETVATLVHALNDKDSNVKISMVEILTAAIAQESFRDKIFDTDIFATLGRALSDEDSDVRSSAVNFFTAAIAQDGFRDKIFVTETLAALVHALSEEDSDIRSHTVNFFTAAISQDGFWDKIFGTDILAVLVRALSDEDPDIRRHVVEIFTSAIPQERFRDKIFDTEIVAAFVRALGDKDPYVRSGAGNFFLAAIAQERVRNKKFDRDIMAALVRALSDEDSNIRRNMVGIFAAAVPQERFRNKMFDSEVMAALMRTLSDEDYDIRRNVVEIFTAAIAQESFQDKIFDTETVAALGRTLGDTDSNVRRSAVNFFTAAIAQDGFRDKIFDVETVAHLIKAQLTVDFWSHGYINPRAYNHFITSTLCEQLTSADLNLRDQTRCFISEAIKHDDVHTRICTVDLRKHFHCPRHVSSA